MKYRVEPGLYALGEPKQSDPVLVSANYRLSFNHLRGSLTGRNAWILALDTKGINVWCAAGKGTFGTRELVSRIGSSGLEGVVSHRTLIVPQLGASGVCAHEVKKQTGFSVRFGPVRARDLPEYLDNNYKATSAMRRVRFSLADRLALVPMELFPALKESLFVLIVIAAAAGLSSGGILFAPAIQFTLPFVLAALVSLACGTVLVPVLLPWIPGRAFSFKGFIVGLAGAACLPLSGIIGHGNVFITLFAAIAVPAYSSFRAFTFTGSTTFTNPSGVKAEIKIAWPAYLASACVATLLLVLAFLKQRGIV
jgi:hypothetical protein